ncbi:hypothetical protein [Nostoc sp. PCC 7107]|uniref:hypothetical protein n=1 Tax=Nostoc sp. PCC 7107 TaxID=317936 RepID=UPI00029F15E1|nr:hypothetical protein [Nostoc sp. PCC 7107]AFY45461.1 hypothetical protein Nos7107_4943 [Nostoc sp. PCC 7107]
MVEPKNPGQIKNPLSIYPTHTIYTDLTPYTERVSLSKTPDFEHPFVPVLQNPTNPPSDAALYQDLMKRDSLKRIAEELNLCTSVFDVSKLFRLFNSYPVDVIKEAINHAPRESQETAKYWVSRMGRFGQSWQILPPIPPVNSCQAGAEINSLSW